MERMYFGGLIMMALGVCFVLYGLYERAFGVQSDARKFLYAGAFTIFVGLFAFLTGLYDLHHISNK